MLAKNMGNSKKVERKEVPNMDTNAKSYLNMVALFKKGYILQT